MKLSISNIAWAKSNDNHMYELLNLLGYKGLEIAPTRIFEKNPYECLEAAHVFKNFLYDKYNLIISSMQSIWFGKTENIFRKDQQKTLIEYTKLAIDFAKVIGCNNLVFGNPKNRNIPDNSDYKQAISFFEKIGDYSYMNNTITALEPNPTIYKTNFLNTTDSAFKFVKEINNRGIKVNVDFGTIIANKESLNSIADNINLVNHVHISEPFLDSITKREQHKELANLLKEKKYQNFVSIEMKIGLSIDEIKETLNYIEEVFI